VPETFKVGLLGHGTVGSAFARLLADRADAIVPVTGLRPEVSGVLTRSQGTFEEILEGCDLIVELMGGIEPARSYVLGAMRAGRHVVSANKQLLSQYGEELWATAREHGVQLRFEGAVAGVVPVIRVLQESLAGARIERVHGIVNGTTNYILSAMAAEGKTYDEALSQAQALGYAEADPTDDVDGFDATYKLAILASIAYEISVHPADIYREGINGIEPVDFRYARELGYAIKLIAHTQRQPGRIEARVHPALVPLDHPLAQVEGADNAVFVEGDLVGRVLLKGQGAGGRPTASAVVGDLIDLARSIRRGVQNRPSFTFDDRIGVIPMGEVVTRAYYRIRAEDRAGVLAAVGQVFAEEGVSISSFIQKDAWVEEKTAELVITTHPTADMRLQKARERIASLQPVRSVSAFLRVY
jgi:homoserine dehydrogenase